MERYYASTSDSFLIRKEMGPGSGHSGWKRFPFTMIPNTRGTWKWENKHAHAHSDTGSPLGRSTLGSIWWGGWMASTPLYPSYSGRAKKGQNQTSKLFPSDCSTRPWFKKKKHLTFLQCLKDAIWKHTTVDLKSQEGEVLLKDKFLSQPQISAENSKSLWLKGKSPWTN
jgi:hypothetical protein